MRALAATGPVTTAEALAYLEREHGLTDVTGRRAWRGADILRRYLAAFGPASRRDIVAWSMMHVPEISRALDRLEPLLRFRDEPGRELLDVPRAVAGRRYPRARSLPAEVGQRAARVRGSDARALGAVPQDGHPHERRRRETFLVDGFVAGTWRVENGRVMLEPFSALPRAVQRELEDEAGRLEAFLAA